MMRILQLSYRLIQHTIKSSHPNMLYASQWIDVFMTHAMFCDNQNNLYAESTLTELISNNERILENRIKRETISRFVDMLITQDKHEKYVNILKALVICNGSAIPSN